jgi:copper chaperone
VDIATTQFKVTGMTCGHCRSAIEGAVRPLAGVQEVHVELGAKMVTVRYDRGQLSTAAVCDAVEGAGYPVDEFEEVGTS